MSDQHDNNARKGKGPELIAYSLQSYGEDKTAWNRVGAAFRHKDGEGYDVILNAVPVDGRLTLREQRLEQYKDERGHGTRRKPRQKGRDER